MGIAEEMVNITNGDSIYVVVVAHPKTGHVLFEDCSRGHDNALELAEVLKEIIRAAVGQ